MYTPVGPFYSVPYDRGELHSAISADLETRLALLTTVPLRPGTKSIIALIDDLVELFTRHLGNASLDLPDYVVKALETLVTALDLIETLNPPGPG